MESKQKEKDKMTQINTQTRNSIRQNITQGESNMKTYNVDPNTVEIHPKAAIISEATYNELVQLEDSIQRHGQFVPAKMLNGRLIDGRARARVCAELGIPLIVEDLPPNTNPKIYISINNMVRRQMSLPQKAAVATLMTEYIRAATIEEKVKIAGKICNVPEKWIYECLEIRDGSEDIFYAVHRGDMNLNRALNEVRYPGI